MNIGMEHKGGSSTEASEILGQAHTRGVCPLCQVIGQTQFAWLARLPQQIVTQPAFPDEFARRYRLCAVHAVEFARLASFRSVVLLHRALAEETLRRWESERAAYVCPVCQALRRRTEACVAALSQALTEPAVREQYRSGPGLCLPHLEAVCCQADPETVTFLRETEYGFWNRLHQQLAPTLPGAALSGTHTNEEMKERKAAGRALEKLSGRVGLPLESP